MKTLIITAAITLSALFASAQSKPNIITKSFPCHDISSNIHAAKMKSIDSLSRIGYSIMGVRVDNTFKKKGYNTLVLTFLKSNK